jgi:hypothetical protein
MTKYPKPRVRWGIAPELGLAIVVLLACAAAAATCSGCGGPPPAVRHTIEVAVLTVQATDLETAPLYSRASADAYARSTTVEEYRVALAPWNALERALRVAQSMLLSADTAFRAWGAGGQERWLALAACVVASLSSLRDALRVVDLRVPPDLDSVIDVAGSLAVGLCEGGA